MTGDREPRRYRVARSTTYLVALSFVVAAVAVVGVVAGIAGAVRVARLSDRSEDLSRRTALLVDAVARTASTNCQQIEIVKRQIRGTVQANLDQLAPPGGGPPTIAYYRRHPRELAAALESARSALRTFKPLSCP